MRIINTLRTCLTLLPLLVLLAGCNSSTGVYKAYLGDARDNLQVARVDGARFTRTDWINRYVDSVRFLSVDGMYIENPEQFESVELPPGFHDVQVYFSWDLGSQRGLAPALVSYASARGNMSRTLRFNALSGERYFVRAQPVFASKPNELADLLYVNFWVEDRAGNEIVTRAEGRYVPPSVDDSTNSSANP